jgi:hypothetical protein
MNLTNKKIVFILRITTSTRTRKRGEILNQLVLKECERNPVQCIAH